MSAILEWIWYDVYTQCGFSVIFFLFLKKITIGYNIHNTKSSEKIKMKKLENTILLTFSFSNVIRWKLTANIQATKPNIYHHLNCFLCNFSLLLLLFTRLYVNHTYFPLSIDKPITDWQHGTVKKDFKFDTTKVWDNPYSSVIFSWEAVSLNICQWLLCRNEWMNAK